MKEIKLSNLNLYENDNQLYIGFGDGFLSKIEGDDVYYVKEILNRLTKSKIAIESDELFQEVDKIIKIERDYFDSLLDWLKGNGIVSFTEKVSSKKKTLNVAVIGVSNNEKKTIIKDINKNLSKDGEYFLNLKKEDDKSLDFFSYVE